MTAETDLIRLSVSQSFLLDADRTRDSYTNHTATALRKRALAASNGHAATGEFATYTKEGAA